MSEDTTFMISDGTFISGDRNVMVRHANFRRAAANIMG
jgi:hypothetical protein